MIDCRECLFGNLRLIGCRECLFGNMRLIGCRECLFRNLRLIDCRKCLFRNLPSLTSLKSHGYQKVFSVFSLWRKKYNVYRKSLTLQNMSTLLYRGPHVWKQALPNKISLNVDCGVSIQSDTVDRIYDFIKFH